MTPKTRETIPLEVLAAYGTALHGPRWVKPLAEDLGVNLRTVQRWASGENTVPAVLLDDLDKVADAMLERVRAAKKIGARCKKTLDP